MGFGDLDFTIMPPFRQRESLDYFLASVINNKADKSECLPSCKLIRKDQGELEGGRNLSGTERIWNFYVSVHSRPSSNIRLLVLHVLH